VRQVLQLVLTLSDAELDWERCHNLKIDEHSLSKAVISVNFRLSAARENKNFLVDSLYDSNPLCIVN